MNVLIVHNKTGMHICEDGAMTEALSPAVMYDEEKGNKLLKKLVESGRYDNGEISIKPMVCLNE